jgi:hypothetical protein
MGNQMFTVPHDLILDVETPPEQINQAQIIQAQLEKDGLTFEEAMLLRMDNPADTRYQAYTDLLNKYEYHKSFAFFADNSALDTAEGIAVKFTHIIDGDIIETTYLD